MSYYAQTNYPQIQGISGRYTIHDIGCFLTSFCNLEQDYGQTIDPLTLNNFFRDNSIFIDVDDGIRDDVDWGFVQRWDVSTRVTQLGGPGWPNSNQAIVKFAYTSPRTGHQTTHFCKVFDYVNQQIVDSWDGVVKHISSTVYGQPVAWATYEHSVPQAVSAAPARTPRDYMQYSAVPNKTMRVNKLTTNWYNLSNDSDNIDNFQVAQTLTVNTPFPIGGYAKNLHFPMYTYAMSPDDFNRAVNGDYSTNNGINLDDLEDIPYTPPAAPLPVPKVDYYELKTTVVYFKSAEDAQKDQNGIGPLNKGTYVLLKSDGNARQLTKNNADTVSYWINDLDNKVEQPVIIAAPAVVQPTLPVDAPKPVIELVNDTSVTAAAPVVPVVPVTPKQPLQWGWINENHQPSIFQNVSHSDVLVNDLEGGNPPLKLPAGAKKICSRYTVINDTSYVLPDKEFSRGLGYGIEETQAIMEIRKPTILTEISGDLLNWANYLETGFKSASRLITDVSPVKISHASQRTKQMIDGFNSKRKVK